MPTSLKKLTDFPGTATCTVLVRGSPIFFRDLQIQTIFKIQWLGGVVVAGCLAFGPGNNPYTQKFYDYSEVYIFLFLGVGGMNVEIVGWMDQLKLVSCKSVQNIG